MPLLSVSAADIDTAGLPLEVELPVEWLDHELSDAQVRAAAPGFVRARLSRSGKSVVVRGRVKAAVTAPCARCLEPTEIAIDAELSLLLVPAAPKPAHGAPTHGAPAHGDSKERRAGPKEAEHEFTADEAEIDTFDGETVVLDELVREAILLEMPNFPLCSEACAGIRPRTAAANGGAIGGAKRPLDPRLAPLGELRAKLFEPHGADETPAPRRAAARPAAVKRARATPLKANLTKTKKKTTKKE